MPRLTTSLPVDIAERLNAACQAAAIPVAGWMRHAVFGEAVEPGLLPTDAAALHKLRDLSAVVLMIGSICARSPSPTRREQATTKLAAIADGIARLRTAIIEPYPPARASGLPLGVLIGPGTRYRSVSIPISDHEYAAIRRTVGESISSWLRDVIDGAGFPAPAVPNMQPVVAGALSNWLVVIRAYGDSPDPTVVADTTIRRAIEAERGLRMLVDTKGVAGAPDEVQITRQEGAR